MFYLLKVKGGVSSNSGGQQLIQVYKLSRNKEIQKVNTVIRNKVKIGYVVLSEKEPKDENLSNED